MTHNLSFYITFNLDYQTVDIKITDGTILKTRDIKIIDFYIIVEN